VDALPVLPVGAGCIGDSRRNKLDKDQVGVWNFMGLISWHAQRFKSIRV
jgi:hypothetical protein